jgi:hypothetical protein
MSTGPLHRGYARPEVPPPVSEWRRKILREYHENRQRPVAVPRAAVAKPEPEKQAKAAKPKPAPKAKPETKPKRVCGCGQPIRKLAAEQCWRCVQKATAKAPARTCSVCETRILRNNRSGLCRRHLNLECRRKREIRDHGERPLCTYEKDGMRCAERIYRDNQIGLCGFHRPRAARSRLGRSPKMIPVAEPRP